MNRGRRNPFCPLWSVIRIKGIQRPSGVAAFGDSAHQQNGDHRRRHCHDGTLYTAGSAHQRPHNGGKSLNYGDTAGGSFIHSSRRQEAFTTIAGNRCHSQSSCPRLFDRRGIARYIVVHGRTAGQHVGRGAKRQKTSVKKKAPCRVLGSGFLPEQRYRPWQYGFASGGQTGGQS